MAQGLIGALKAMAEKTHETYSQNVVVEAEENVISQLEMSRQTIIFYIAEEALIMHASMLRRIRYLGPHEDL